MPLQENTLFNDRYLLIKLLGSGGFSEVWLAEDTKVGNTKMVLKIYAPGKGLDEDGVQLFSREFELVFGLNHSHLLCPSYFDVCERSPYLVMPFCEHGSASKLTGKITEEQALRFLHDVASGLAYMHEQKPPIIHQDIKPDNVLIDRDGNYLITDFGISAKARSTLRQSVGHVQSAGTIAYMAPERFGADNSPVKASDIWSLGAALFELMTGDAPFGDHGGLIQKSGADIPVIKGAYSQNLKAMVYKMLVRDTWERPTAQQLLEWTDKRIQGEKAIPPRRKEVEVRPMPPTRDEGHSSGSKFLWVIVGCICLLGLGWHFLPEIKEIIKDLQDGDTGANTTVVQEPPVQQPPADSAPVTPADTVPKVTAPPTNSQPEASWIADYERYLNLALSAFQSQDYEKAKNIYNQALNIANQNGDEARTNLARRKVTECYGKIQEQEQEQVLERQRQIDEQIRLNEAGKKASEERLTAYNFVGTYTLGSNYYVVQRKSDYQWGIIDRDGNVKVSFIYDQKSDRLYNGYYALANKQGWDVFNTSSAKVDSELRNLDNYK